MVQELSINDSAQNGSGIVALSYIFCERREARRFKVGWQTVIEGTNRDGESFEERTKLMNLSSTGAYFKLKIHLEKGAKVKVSIKVPLSEDNWMMYWAIVVRIKGLRRRNGIAIRFLGSRPAFYGR